jgi:hypothetical protein
MSEPSFTPNNINTWYVPGQTTYNLSDLFTFDPGTDSTVTRARVEFAADNPSGITFSGTPSQGTYYEYVLYGSPLANPGSGDFSSGTVTFPSGLVCDMEYDWWYVIGNSDEPGFLLPGFVPADFGVLAVGQLAGQIVVNAATVSWPVVPGA